MAHMVREGPDMDEYDQKRAFSFNENLLENDCRMEGKTFVSGYRKEDNGKLYNSMEEYRKAHPLTEKEKEYADMMDEMDKYTSSDEWEEFQEEEHCKSKGMEWVSGHYRHKNGKRVAYISGHCRKKVK